MSTRNLRHRRVHSRGDEDANNEWGFAIVLLDKSLNYGNSGGPIVAVGTGKAHAFCSRFQPVRIPQGNPADPKTQWIMIPSLYGVVSSLGNQSILHELGKRGVPVSAS